MPTLAEIVNDRASVTFGEGAETITIDYRPQRATALPVLKFLRDLQSWDRDSAGIDEVIEVSERIAQALADLMTSWDALESDGSVVAITAERLGHEGLPALMSLFDAIMQDARRGLGEQNGMRSSKPMSATSGQRARSTSGRKGASRSSR